MFFLAASATEVRSASRRIATICSSLNQILCIRSSLSEEPFFQKLMDRKTDSGIGRKIENIEFDKISDVKDRGKEVK